MGSILLVSFFFLFQFFFQTLLASTVDFGVEVAPSEVPYVELPFKRNGGLVLQDLRADLSLRGIQNL